MRLAVEATKRKITNCWHQMLRSSNVDKHDEAHWVDSEDSSYETFDPWPLIPRLLEIPEIFHSLERDGPFEQCLLCQTALLDSTTGYMIERIFRGAEPIVEYAICASCQEEASGQMSVSSMQQIQQLFGAIDLEARAERLRPHKHDGNADAWLNECFLTGKLRSDCRGYQVITKCSNMNIELGLLPIMLSDDAAKQISAAMSQETRGYMDDFMEHFGMPPEFSLDPEWTPVFI